MGTDDAKRQENPPAKGTARSEARRHHFVPEFYLRRFATPKHKIEVFDRRTGRKFGTNTSKIAVEVGYNDLPAGDGSRSLEAEHRFQRVENEAALVLQKIDYPPDGWNGPSLEERAVLAIYMALQITRTPDARAFEEESSDLLFRMWLDLNLTGAPRERVSEFLSDMYERPATDGEIEAIHGLVEGIEEFRFTPPRAHLLNLTFETALGLAPILSAKPWTVLRSPTKAFLTNDRPVTLWRERTTRDEHYGIGVATAEAIFFPLDPQKMLVLGPDLDESWQVKPVSSAEVKRLNRIVAHWAYRYIYHHPDHHPLEGESISQDGPVLHINGIPVRPGANVWNQLRGKFHAGTTIPVIHWGYNVDRRGRR